MGRFRFSMFLFVFSCLALTVFANQPFYELNSELRRIGLDELLGMEETEFESGNYRLDPDFTLGYGDTIVVNFWGKVEAVHKLTINRNGNVLIPLLGQISLIGLTIGEAREVVKQELDKKYINVEFELSLADVQNIRITVLGNVNKPGPYSVSPFCRLAEAVAKSGGPNDNGSLIDIRVIRDNEETVSFDIYEFILKGDESKNIRLRQGDKIYIPQVNELVALKGEVRYPGIYEVKTGALLSEFLDVAGGMLSTDIQRKIYVLRNNSENQSSEIFREIVFDLLEGIKKEDNIILKHGDSVNVAAAFGFSPYMKNFFRSVSVTGEVEKTGKYLVKEGELLSSLLKRAGGIKNTAFLVGAEFTRKAIKQKQKSILDVLVRVQERLMLKEELRLVEAILTKEEREIGQRALQYRKKAVSLMASKIFSGRIIINLEDIINGKSDINLEKDDSLHVPSIPDWVLIVGDVYNSQAVSYKKGEPWEYYLNIVGGVNKYADKEDIYIIKANGQVKSKSTGYSPVERGDIIVVPEKM